MKEDKIRLCKLAARDLLRLKQGKFVEIFKTEVEEGGEQPIEGTIEVDDEIII